MLSALEAQRAAFARAAPDYRQRMDALSGLRDALRAKQGELLDALSADFGGRAREEGLLFELFQLSEQIAHARSRLARWMKPKRVSSSWFLLPSSAYVVHQPLGVVGAVGAWNFPLLLTLGPAIDALAAGNHVMLKPSELAPHSAEMVAGIVRRLFPPEYVTTILGGPDVAREFCSLPFDHLIFTGSSRIGADVMRAASENLTPVTLELGGKSPVIIHESYPLDVALRRTLVAKLYNAGQSCLAPDYLLIPRGREEAVRQSATGIVARLYPSLAGNPGYTRLLRPNSYERLSVAVEEAAARGASVVRLNPASEPCTPENRVFPPTLVFGAAEDSLLLREEIFGPVLPVLTYGSLDEAIAYVNARPRPLALYYFDNDRSRIRRVVSRTYSGAVCINDAALQFAQYNLPFGGVGQSGMGQYHGVHGFQTFSKEKAIMVQSRWPVTQLLAPPYNRRVRAVIDGMLRWSRR